MRIKDLDRFCAKVNVDPSGCWQWTGYVAPNGYAGFCMDGKRCYAHRAAYEGFMAEIPAGFWIDHLCRNRSCANPLHLEAVTPRENLMRGDTPAARHAAKTHCLRGHAFTAENTSRNARGSRVCLTCKRARDQRRRTMERVA